MKLATITMATVLTTASIAFAQEEVMPIDTDEDGMISAEELMAAFPDVNEDMFTAADMNGDGLLDPEEYASAQEDGLIPADEAEEAEESDT
ncbi:EF-hand domain-containing protein [Maritimibacter harenae]|jgi:Ca2+-binding EF-hand superfamily protein|nr:EF-hand domain-containing protein [Maritimibacter harenae]